MNFPNREILESDPLAGLLTSVNNGFRTELMNRARTIRNDYPTGLKVSDSRDGSRLGIAATAKLQGQYEVGAIQMVHYIPVCAGGGCTLRA